MFQNIYFNRLAANCNFTTNHKEEAIKMSRFTNLKKQLGFWKAISFYRKVKRGNLSNLKIDTLARPFTLRNNPFDYATFEEVVLNEAYNIPLPFTPKYIIESDATIVAPLIFAIILGW